MDSPAQDLTTRPISEHNGDLVCILVKVMQFDNVLVHLGALVVAGDRCPGLCATGIQPYILHVHSSTETTTANEIRVHLRHAWHTPQAPHGHEWSG